MVSCSSEDESEMSKNTSVLETVYED